MSDVIRDDTIDTDITGLSVDVTSLSFTHFKELVPSTDGKTLPTVKALRDSDAQILVIVETRDGILTIYRNGFFSYVTKTGHATVYAVDRCSCIVLNPTSDDPASVLDETNFGDCPWTKVLEFVASERIINNINRDARRQEILSLDVVDEDWDKRLTVQPEFETRLEEEDALIEESEKLRAALTKLTNRQREIIRLYYFDGLSQGEIATRLTLDKSTVSITLKRAIEKVKRCFEITK